LLDFNKYKYYIQTLIEYTAISVFAWLFRCLPLQLARRIADVIAGLASQIIRLRRNVAIDNLYHAFPDKSRNELEIIYNLCWCHFVRLGAEIARLPRIDEQFIKRWIDMSSIHVLEEALAEGKGCIVVSGHFGNWEWMGGPGARLGYPITYVVTSQTNKLAEQWLDRMRESTGVEVIHRRNAVRGVLNAIKRNRIIAILCDQDAGNTGVFVPFFNRMASTPRGPALFHIKTGVPLIFGSNPVDRNGKYKITLERMNFTGLTGKRSEDEEQIMAQITKRLEEEIRKHPEQWLWLHRRWKTQPK